MKVVALIALIVGFASPAVAETLSGRSAGAADCFNKNLAKAPLVIKSQDVAAAESAVKAK